MSVNWYSYPTPDAAAKASARKIAIHLEQALAGNREATLAVSGGSTPKLMFGYLAIQPEIDWHRVHLFFVDERCVPPEHEESNFRLAEEHLVKPAHLPHRHVHRIRGELRPEIAAQTYSDEIAFYFDLDDGQMPAFDVIHRGMGADAHTASLFPGEPLIEDREGIAAAVYVEKLGKHRVTLLPGVLLHARHTVVLAAGADKADPVYEVFNAKHNPLRLPSQIDTPHGRNIAWYLDEAAAAKLS